MRAVRITEIDRADGPSKMHVATVDDPSAGPGQILVRIRCAAFNRRDVYITQGLYPGIALPVIPGSDGVGTVEAHGEGATGPAVGTRVVIDPMLGWGSNPRIWQKGHNILGMPTQGTFAELVAVPAENVHAAPASLDDAEAASLPLGGLTAYRAVVTRGAVKADDVVFIPGIGSGVQTFAMLFAKRAGARVVVSSSSDEKLAKAKELGADDTINYKSSENWVKELRAKTGGGPTLVIDSIGGETFAGALDAAREAARVVTYGGTTGDAKIRPFSIFWKQLDVLGTSMGAPEDFRSMLAVFDGSIKPVVDSVHPMDDVVAAARKVEKGDQMGKVVLKIA